MYPLARRPRADIAFRLVMAALCLLYALAQVLLGVAGWLTPVLVVVGAYDGVTGLRRLRLHLRGELADHDVQAWIARHVRTQDEEPEIVDEWHSDDEWVAVSALDGRGRETHEIAVDDWIAHLRDEAVEQYLQFLRTRPGVAKAWREDRELLLVVAPGVAAQVLGREAHAWFRARITEPEDLHR
jgi:hypothetical protein